MQILIIFLTLCNAYFQCSSINKPLSYRDKPQRKALERKVLENISLNHYPICYAKMGDEEKTLYIIYNDPSNAFSKDKYIKLINNHDLHRQYLFETKLFQEFDEIMEVNGCEQKVGNDEEVFMYSRKGYLTFYNYLLLVRDLYVVNEKIKRIKIRRKGRIINIDLEQFIKQTKPKRLYNNYYEDIKKMKTEFSLWECISKYESCLLGETGVLIHIN